MAFWSSPVLEGNVLGFKQLQHGQLLKSFIAETKRLQNTLRMVRVNDLERVLFALFFQKAVKSNKRVS